MDEKKELNEIEDEIIKQVKNFDGWIEYLL